MMYDDLSDENSSEEGILSQDNVKKYSDEEFSFFLPEPKHFYSDEENQQNFSDLIYKKNSLNKPTEYTTNNQNNQGNDFKNDISEENSKINEENEPKTIIYKKKKLFRITKPVQKGRKRKPTLCYA